MINRKEFDYLANSTNPTAFSLLSENEKQDLYSTVSLKSDLFTSKFNELKKPFRWLKNFEHVYIIKTLSEQLHILEVSLTEQFNEVVSALEQ